MNNSVFLPIRENKYYPKDTYETFNNYTNPENFFYFFNMPVIIEHGDQPEKIRINENIEKFRWDSYLIKQLNERRVITIKQLGLEIKDFSATLSWRMVIGLGASHPQETSMTLHHIYGIPYIPGSAVKGVTRHWIILSKFNEDEKEAEKDNTFQNIFGTQKEAGKIIFFDAYPVDEIKLKLDIMNPHYPDYYSENTPPADWQSPVPIKFLTVEKTKFSFHLAAKKDAQNFLNTATTWLKEALENYGIGAKTSLGYGIFIWGEQL
jgi:CRISPR-associated protein Cmr6